MKSADVVAGYRIRGAGCSHVDPVNPIQPDEQGLGGRGHHEAGDQTALVEPEDLSVLDALVQVEPGIAVHP